jgi:hypothetical protein
MSMRAMIAVAVLILVTSLPGYGQKATGLSPSGPLKAVDSDTSATAGAGAQGSVTFDMEFTEPSGNEYLEQKETGRLRIAISNPGSVTAKGVHVRLNALQEVKGVSYQDSIFVGDISGELEQVRDLLLPSSGPARTADRNVWG